MIEPVAIKLIWVGVAVVAYGLLRWRWLIATQDVVIGVVQDAERWCRSAGASATAKGRVERFASAAYRPLATWRIALLVSLGVVVAVLRRLRKHTVPARTDATDEEALMSVRLLAAVLNDEPNRVGAGGCRVPCGPFVSWFGEGGARVDPRSDHLRADEPTKRLKLVALLGGPS